MHIFHDASFMIGHNTISYMITHRIASPRYGCLEGNCLRYPLTMFSLKCYLGSNPIGYRITKLKHHFKQKERRMVVSELIREDRKRVVRCPLRASCIYGRQCSLCKLEFVSRMTRVKDAMAYIRACPFHGSACFSL